MNKYQKKHNRAIFYEAFLKTLPIMGSYLFVSMAYGLMMQNAGFGWGFSLLTSLSVYTGAFQFVLVTFLSSGASFVTIALTALFMNSRQFFYGLTFLRDFRKMGWRYPYMIHTMTDETYAVNCTLLPENEETESAEETKNRRRLMFWIAVLARCSWMVGAVLGGVLGQLIPMELEGIDFSMTALFVTIFVDQWRSAKSHLPAVLGILVGAVLLLCMGPKYFLLPSLVLVSGLLLVFKNRIEENADELNEEVVRNEQ